MGVPNVLQSGPNDLKNGPIILFGLTRAECLGTRQKTKVPSCQVVVPLPAGRVDWVVASLGGPGRTGIVLLEELVHQQRLIFGQC